MNRHVIQCAIAGVIPRVFWIEQVLANTSQAMLLTHTYGVRPRKDHHGVGKSLSVRVAPQRTRVGESVFYRRKSLLDEDFAFAMRQAKEAAEQLPRSP
jgi:hypothetical protein